ncbi:TonB-dependent receptor plug domain-containing protein [Pseudoalteromonas sp.]|uniref:TonB-dependent receptor plug domain-containing protein n=1 Tax=Pseudoalteromonas sp. TaxID=53249 RepID=UPI0035667020
MASPLTMQFKKITTLLAVLFCFSNICYANEEGLFELSLEELLNTNISIATAVPVSMVNAPSTVSLFTKGDLERLGVSRLTELFSFIPGFNSQYNSVEGNQSYLITRGHAQKYANTVLFLLNGQRINDDYTGGVSYFVRYFDLTNVQRIEVIRGPGSALYGSNAFNGVVNIITQVENHVSFTSGNKLNYSASFAARLNSDKFSAGLAYHVRDDNGDEFNNIFDRFGIHQQTYDPNKSSQVALSLDYAKFSYRGFYNQSQREQFYLFRRLANDINKLDLNSENHQIKVTHSFANNLNINLSAGLFKASRKSLGQIVPLNIDGFTQAPFLFGVDVEYRSSSLALDSDIYITKHHHLYAGASYTTSKLPRAALGSNYNLYGDFENLNSFTIFGEPSQRSVLDMTRETSSVYLQLQSQLSDQLNTTLGLRYDKYNDVDNKLNPRIALNYSASDNHLFKVIYGSAYRVPSLGDLYDEESGLTQGNFNLNPTTLKSTEIAYSYLNDCNYFSAVYFYNDIDNLIGFTSGDISQLDNIAANKAKGIELEWKRILSDKLTAYLTFTHLFSNNSRLIQQTELTPSEYLVPDRHLTTVLDYNVFDNLHLNFQYFWHDDIEVVKHSHNHRMNVIASYQILQDVMLSLKVTNLFDSKLAVGSSLSLGIDPNSGQAVQEYPLRGREIEFKVKYTF